MILILKTRFAYVLPAVDAPMRDGCPLNLAADAPMTPDADSPAISGDAGPGVSGDAVPGNRWHLGAFLGILITLFSSSETRNGSLLVWAKSTHSSGGFACGALFVSSWAGVSLSYATSKVPSVKIPDPVLAAT